MFQSTRLGKYINQVRRTIPDKSLAKRMKRLVIQWRSLAQKSPSTPNGVPTRSTPPPHTTTTPSPPSPRTGTTLTPAQKQNLHMSTQTQANTPIPSDQPTSTANSSQPPISSCSSLAPPSRPSSANPAVNRKRALHRLSTVKFPPNASQPQNSSQLPVPQSTQHTLSPSPPLPNTSHTPAVSTTSPAVRPALLAVSAAQCSDNTEVPSSLQVRFPLHSVVKSLIVKVPLARVKVPWSASEASVPVQPLRTASPIDSETSATQIKLQPLGSSCKSKATPTTGGLGLNEAQPTPKTVRASSSDVSQPPPQGLENYKTLTQTGPLTLIVSIDRGMLNQHSTSNLQPEISTSTSSGTSQPTKSSADASPPPDFNRACPDSLYSKESPSPSTCSAKHTANNCSSDANGYLDLDSVWRKWTDPIIHEDSFAVNVLPYVYVDGLDEDMDAGDVC